MNSSAMELAVSRRERIEMDDNGKIISLHTNNSALSRLIE